MIGVGSIVLGGLLVCVLPFALVALTVHAAHAAPPPDGDPAPDAASGPANLLMGGALAGFLWPLLGCGLAISTCYARLKYW